MPTPVLTPADHQLSWHPITNADIDGWEALLRRMAEVDKPDWIEQKADLEEVFSASKNDPSLDTVMGFDEEGTPRAFGRISANAGSNLVHAFGGVDPVWRRRGIGRAIHEWQVERAHRRLTDAGIPDGFIRSYVEENNPGHRALMEAAGNRITRWFTEMTRDLSEEIPEVDLDPEFGIVTFSDDISEAVRLAHNEAFQDHWGSEPRDEESWHFTVSHPEFRAEWSLAVIDNASGEVAAYEIASYDPESKQLVGHDEGYTELLGVRRDWRGRRLAPALLAEAMRRFKADGMENAGLGVDTENPSGALGLYERMGYTPTRRSMAFERLL
ncbi:ribosomal protein S18 acetylase RimI-like enzyme [Arthrobacter pigmenti]|uniref:Ribosomal protein S18 acetylase RimI-like enzyme n=1 Tax=Arthrobacter pigmenti TaxID=271432 RepID=A0A846RKD3_9MICC|nr:N-acetyltransferase [Arthrobacter pigmenti]NJC22130.1 ribosomal protein S18 acetylase RimI-like enzyme [Arthrobacter pigmenti]